MRQYWLQMRGFLHKGAEVLGGLPMHALSAHPDLAAAPSSQPFPWLMSVPAQSIYRCFSQQLC